MVLRLDPAPSTDAPEFTSRLTRPGACGRRRVLGSSSGHPAVDWTALTPGSSLRQLARQAVVG